MKKNDLKKEVLEMLLNHLVDMGFDEKIHGQDFLIPTKSGHGSVHLTFVNHYDDFDIVVNFSVRLDFVEEWKNKDNKYLKAKEKKETATIGIELGNLTEGKQKRWTVARRDEIPDITKDIAQNVVEYGLPYIEKYSDPNNALEVCLREDRTGWMHSPVNHLRAINAVALAKMMERADVHEIAETKKKYLEETDDQGLLEFEQFTKRVIGG